MLPSLQREDFLNDREIIDQKKKEKKPTFFIFYQQYDSLLSISTVPKRKNKKRSYGMRVLSMKGSKSAAKHYLDSVKEV